MSEFAVMSDNPLTLYAFLYSWVKNENSLKEGKELLNRDLLQIMLWRASGIARN